MLHRPVSLSPRWILFRQCLYIATGWYAGAYIIRDARVRVHVQGVARVHTNAELPRCVCISVRRASFSDVPLGGAYKVMPCVRVGDERVRLVSLPVYEGNAKKWADVSVGAVSVLGHPRVHPVAPMYQACARVSNAYWVSGGSTPFLRAFFWYRSPLKYAPIDFYWNAVRTAATV